MSYARMGLCAGSTRGACWWAGGSPRMIGIAIDISKLRRSEADYRSIVKTAPFGMFPLNGGWSLFGGEPCAD